jgi:hypothetical protein
MLPLLGHAEHGRIVDESDFNRPIDEHEIRERLRSMNERWKYAVEQRDFSGIEEDDKRDLHAELVVSTTEIDENRANELLYLSEHAILRTLGNVPTSRVETSVVTSQPNTQATLVIYEKGVRNAARVYGLTSLDERDVEDFVVKKASVEYQAVLLRFYNTDILKGDNSPMLTVRLDLTGRTLQIQRPPQTIDTGRLSRSS